MGDLEDPTADKEIKPPRIDAEVPAGSNYQGNTKEEVESFEHGVPMMQMIEEERRRKEAAKPKINLQIYMTVCSTKYPQEIIEVNDMSCDCGHCVGMTTAWDALERNCVLPVKRRQKEVRCLPISLCKRMGCTIL